jgi:hypothetical protein
MPFGAASYSSSVSSLSRRYWRMSRRPYFVVTVLFASYEDLIDFKNIAGRDQDLIDIRALREARGETDSFNDSAPD